MILDFDGKIDREKGTMERNGFSTFFLKMEAEEYGELLDRTLLPHSLLTEENAVIEVYALWDSEIGFQNPSVEIDGDFGKYQIKASVSLSEKEKESLAGAIRTALFRDEELMVEDPDRYGRLSQKYPDEKVQEEIEAFVKSCGIDTSDPSWKNRDFITESHFEKSEESMFNWLHEENFWQNEYDGNAWDFRFEPLPSEMPNILKLSDNAGYIFFYDLYLEKTPPKAITQVRGEELLKGLFDCLLESCNAEIAKNPDDPNIDMAFDLMKSMGIKDSELKRLGYSPFKEEHDILFEMSENDFDAEDAYRFDDLERDL